MKKYFFVLALSVVCSSSFAADQSWFGFGSSSSSDSSVNLQGLDQSINKFVQSTLSDSLKMAGVAASGSGNFENDINKYVQTVVQNSMKLGSEAAQSGIEMGMKEANKITQDSLKSAFSSSSFSAQGAGFLKMDDFQKNLGDFISKTLQSSMQGAGSGADTSKLMGDFFKSQGFKSSVGEFKADGGFDSDKWQKEFDSQMGAFEKNLESSMQQMEKNLESSMQQMEKNIESSVQQNLKNSMPKGWFGSDDD